MKVILIILSLVYVICFIYILVCRIGNLDLWGFQTAKTVYKTLWVMLICGVVVLLFIPKK